MCGIGGMKIFSNKGVADKLNIIAKALSSRGTHATGVAYVSKKKIEILKAPMSPLDVDYETLFAFGPKMTGKTILFHNRFATNGNPQENKNNHPFLSEKYGFALAHNGVLNSYKEVENQLHIKRKVTEPETDSFSIVKAIDKYLDDGLTMVEAIKKASGLFWGSSLCLEILDKDDNLYLVKGDTYSVDLFQIDKDFIWLSEQYNNQNRNAVAEILSQSTGKIVINQIDIPRHMVVKIDKNGVLSSSQYEKNKDVKITSKFNYPKRYTSYQQSVAKDYKDDEEYLNELNSDYEYYNHYYQGNLFNDNH